MIFDHYNTVAEFQLMNMTFRSDFRKFFVPFEERNKLGKQLRHRMTIYVVKIVAIIKNLKISWII